MKRDEPGAKQGWLARLKTGLKRSTGALAENITGLLTRRRLDDAALEDLEEILIGADLGLKTAREVVEGLRRTRFGKDVTDIEIRTALADVVAQKLEPVAKPFKPVPECKPHVVLVVGVNGSGKTTTIGKFAHWLRGEGLSVMLAAGDTFRAAAIEQLRIWGERTGCMVVSGQVGSDAAALAFESLTKARAAGADVLLIDTAGRLQNKTHLMAELEKIRRVLKKLDPSAPHSTLLVLDATTGQNAINQVDVFRSVCDVTGLVMTKLDGTARGGILVAVAERFGLPVHAIGVGEGAEDLQPFDPRIFAHALSNLEA